MVQIWLLNLQNETLKLHNFCNWGCQFLLQKRESKDQREISQCLWPVVDLVVDVNGDVFFPYSETAVLAHKRIVNIIGETLIKRIHTSVGIAQL